MCVKLVKNNIEVEYNCDKPLMDQVYGVSEIVVNYRTNDKEIKTFLKEMQKCVSTGVNPKVKVRVEYNDFLNGYKTKKKIAKAMNDIALNEVIKLVALMQHSIDKSLEELSLTCLNR
jgi:hypothetical protein